MRFQMKTTASFLRVTKNLFKFNYNNLTISQNICCSAFIT